MKRKFMAGLVLGLSLITNLAFAEIDPDYVQQRLNDYKDYPLATICIGSDVNLRTEPNTNCEVITMLQDGDVFYVKEVVAKPDYNWFKGVNASGETGYMVSKYLIQAPRAAVPSERFRAAFNTSRIFDYNQFAKELGINFKFNPEKLEQLQRETFHYAPLRMKVGKHWFHGDKDGNLFYTLGVIIAAPGYKVAGLEVGQKITKENVLALNKNMNLIGWIGPDNFDSGIEECYWYYEDTVDGQNRPVEGFAVFTKNNVISKIQYWNIPID